MPAPGRQTSNCGPILIERQLPFPTTTAGIHKDIHEYMKQIDKPTAEFKAMIQMNNVNTIFTFQLNHLKADNMMRV
ncbi:hypothetical protein PRIPAC_97819 [Pristionchus pacificus]|uniref:Uncharacterized protein n=1 Tax=Pristionchus pacificus TaxID=54126 RepID=A0A2A6BBV8_PRIPA|nr:hypothetical protein PRIPAC_97819 [Pristionchus pacificus]|eukprot:PDM63359.1 hypothetical protein PRIPAC_53716 [Pristionchus pacificus]